MQAYLIRILTLSCLCGLAEQLTPAGEREGLRRSVRLLTALCLLSLAVSPLWQVRDALGGWDPAAWARTPEGDGQAAYEARMAEKWQTAAEGQLCEELCALLAERFDVAAEDLSVTLSWTEEAGARQLSGVWIALRGGAVLRDPRAIEETVEALLSCPCTVSVG